jgi:hypothetical protein
MTDIVNAEDSTGATEAETAQDEMIEGNAETTNESQGELDDDSVYEIADIRATAKELREWKQAHEGKKSQDADYTRKSQRNAEEAKQLKAEREKLGDSLSMLTELENEIAELAMGDLNKLDMEELRLTDPSEYLRVKELKEQRGKWRESLQTKLQAVQTKLAADGFSKLSEQHGWSNQEKFDADRKAIESYVNEAGMDQREFAKIVSPHVMTALLEAAKYRELMKSKPTMTKRVTQAPKTSKPAQSAATKPLSLAERMYGKK